MSASSTIALTAKILEAANLALAINMRLIQTSQLMAKAHSEGRTLSDEELDSMMNETQAHIDALRDM